MKTKIKVNKPNGMSPDYHCCCEIHISSNGVLCIKKYNRFIKTYAEGTWTTAEEVPV